MRLFGWDHGEETSRCDDMPFSTTRPYRKPDGACAPTPQSGNFRRALRRPRFQRAGYKHSPLARLRRALTRVFDPGEAASPPTRLCRRTTQPFGCRRAFAGADARFRGHNAGLLATACHSTERMAWKSRRKIQLDGEYFFPQRKFASTQNQMLLRSEVGAATACRLSRPSPSRKSISVTVRPSGGCELHHKSTT